MSMPDTINIESKLSQFSDHWNPRIVANYNGNDVRVSKLKGDFTWHSQTDTDELFLVLEGALDIEFRGGIRHIGKGEMIVVPKGTEHRPFCEDECQVMVMDREGEPNAGANPSDLTREALEAI